MQFRNFIRRFQFEYLYDVLKDAATRFPLPVLCCALGTLVCMLSVHDIEFDDEMTLRILTFLSLGAVYFTSARLFAEGRGLKASAQALMMAAGAALLAAAAFMPAHFSAMHLFIGAALALSLLVAPYAGRAASEDSVWYFNYCSGVALVVAGLSAFILCLGLSAIVGSMDYLLFDMKFNKKIYAHIWLFGAGFFGPVAFLHQVPRRFDFESGAFAIPRGVSYIANYLVVPLVLIYTWVLYAYFLKIAANMELPKGNLAWMVTTYGALGVAARLAVFPLRGTGTALLRQFYRFFPWLLVVPVLLLALGLYTRLREYGVTEERYAIGVCFAWLAGICAWHILKPQRAHIKHVPMALCVLFLLGAAGPWGAVDMSTRSQVARLENLLKKAGVIAPSGAVVKTAQDVSFGDRQDISSILDYLYGGGRQKRIAALTAPFKKELESKDSNFEESYCRDRFFGCRWETQRSQKLMAAWGMKYVSRWDTAQTGDYISVRAHFFEWNTDQMTRVAPYGYIVRFYAYTHAGGGEWKTERGYGPEGAEEFRLEFALDRAGVFTVTRKDGAAQGPRLAFELQPLLEKLHAAGVTEIRQDEAEKLTLRGETAGLKAEIRISELRGHMRGAKIAVESAQVTVLSSP